MRSLGIYIHVPFCVKKCPYCNFYSIVGNNDLIRQYVQKVCEEIEFFASKISGNYIVDTIYFGGGTPNLLENNDISKIIKKIESSFFTNFQEITIEVNPELVKINKKFDFNTCKTLKINRISLGAQSFNEDELLILGRRHKKDDIFESIEAIKSSGIYNISLDLIIGSPSQSTKKIKKSLNFIHNLHIPHISAYLLEIKKGTEYFRNQEKLNLPKDEKIVELYNYLCKKLKKIGYNHYEISNFAKKGFESKHNLKYWNFDNYLGIGPGAHSFINKKRFYYKADLKNFLSKSEKILDDTENFCEIYTSLQLRKSSGLKNDEFKKIFGTNIPKTYFDNARNINDKNLVKVNENSIKLTQKGFIVSNILTSKILWG